jgi:hypothetical protein
MISRAGARARCASRASHLLHKAARGGHVCFRGGRVRVRSRVVSIPAGIESGNRPAPWPQRACFAWSTRGVRVSCERGPSEGSDRRQAPERRFSLALTDVAVYPPRPPPPWAVTNEAGQSRLCQIVSVLSASSACSLGWNLSHCSHMTSLTKVQSVQGRHRRASVKTAAPQLAFTSTGPCAMQRRAGSGLALNGGSHRIGSTRSPSSISGGDRLDRHLAGPHPNVACIDRES